jgi:hypothetical protein
MSSDETTKLDKTGQPFRSEEAAQAALKRAELSPDVWGVFPRDGGWILRTHAAVLAEQKAAATAEADAGRAKAIAGEKYFWVQFPGRSSTHDSEKVEIAWQGIRITVSREVKVALPQRFLGVCDCAVQQVFEPAPRGTHAFQRAGLVKRRPYMLLGEATREDFLKQWTEGNNITRRQVQASGGRPHETSAAPV